MLFISEHKKIDDSDDVADDGGRKIVFDNLDMYIQPHQTSEDNQNQDLHWVSVMATENRISGNHLPSEKPNQTESISNMDNAKFLPSKRELENQRSNYATLISRVLTKHIDCLSFLDDVAVKHIPHQYSKETSKPTETVRYIIYSIINFQVTK